MMRIHDTPPPEAYIGDYLANGRLPPAMVAMHMGEAARQLLAVPPQPLTMHPDTSVDDVWQHYDEHVTDLHSNAKSLEVLAQKQALVDAYTTRFERACTDAVQSPGQYLRSGAQAHAYQLELGGHLYVVRQLLPELDYRGVDDHVTASIAVSDLKCFEHIVAASYQHSRTVAPYIHGERFETYTTAPKLRLITEQQLRTFYRNLSVANERNVGVDTYGEGNVIYHPVNGFTAIDLGPLNDDRAAYLHANDTLVNLCYKLFSRINNDPNAYYQLDALIERVVAVLEAADEQIAIATLQRLQNDINEALRSSLAER